MRKIKGVFLENLELNDFPVDVQVTLSLSSDRPANDIVLCVEDLTITISTSRTTNEVLLVPDTEQFSAINTRKWKSEITAESSSSVVLDAFIDQQEWRLHEHVETSTKLLASPFTPSQNQHPAFSATCETRTNA